jgi:hypothetical protein
VAVPSRLAALPTAAAAAVLAGACLVVLALAFLAGRLTAPAHGATGPQLQVVHGTGAPLSLPHLSQALPLPALAAAATKPKPRVIVRAPKPVVHRTKPKHAGGPVDIVGSG